MWDLGFPSGVAAQAWPGAGAEFGCTISDVGCPMHGARAAAGAVRRGPARSVPSPAPICVLHLTYTASCISHPPSCILHPPSRILHPASCIRLPRLLLSAQSRADLAAGRRASRPSSRVGHGGGVRPVRRWERTSRGQHGAGGAGGRGNSREESITWGCRHLPAQLAPTEQQPRAIWSELALWSELAIWSELASIWSELASIWSELA